MLLLHGFPDHWRLWQPLMPTLATRHRVLAPDLRGINLSGRPLKVDAYRIECLVDDVLALIHTRGGRCAVVGHDWGGMLAWVLAARHPTAVSRLAILNAPHPCRLAQQLRDDPAQRAASAYVRALTQSGAEARLAEANFERLWAVVASAIPAAQAQAERHSHVAAWSQPGALTAMLNWYRALDFDAALAPAGVPALPALGTASGYIEAPTLVLWGEQDGSFPVACLNGLEHWVPRLQLHRVPQGGHWLLREQPQWVAERLLDFLAEAH